MKRLSREERVGAVVLAVITILMVAGLFMFRGCGRSADAELPKVTVITQPADSADSAANRKDKKNRKHRARKSRKKGASYGSSHRNKSHDNARDDDTHTPRDPLSEPIATTREGE